MPDRVTMPLERRFSPNWAKTKPALEETEERPEFDGMTQQETLELLFDLVRI